MFYKLSVILFGVKFLYEFVLYGQTKWFILTSRLVQQADSAPRIGDEHKSDIESSETKNFKTETPEKDT